MTQQLEFSPLARKDDWGPLELLEGQWIGSRERRCETQDPEQFYEVRTFKRRPVEESSLSNVPIFPIRYSWKLFHLYDQARQVAEETGYLLWVPDREQVVQINIQPTGLWKSETGSIESVGKECCLVFLPIEHGSLFQSIGEVPIPCIRSVETTMIFNASTLRFDHSCVLNAPGQHERPTREIGELIRVRSARD